MAFLVPEQLESDRLLLRQFRETDWRDMHAYYSDEEATRYTFGKALSEGETWRTLCTMIGHWHVRGYGPYALESKSSGEVLGTVGFWYPLDWPEVEIKWGLARAHWGQGYAKEAARVVHTAGREFLPEIPLISVIDDANTASIGVALALGAEPEGTWEYKGKPNTIYRHRAE